MRKSIVFICVAFAGWMCKTESDGWVDLIQGEDLSGWKKLNGEALYRIENGEIVGTTVMNTPNTFLATEQEYGDFILELELLGDSLLNSGIQIRSESKEDYMNGRVHGYQIEVDPSPRAYSGGIYDEARRDWLYTLARNEKGRKAYKIHDWNSYRIEAIGSTIRVWVNGVNTANLVDDMTPIGFIALQVHGIGQDKKREGVEIRWRNIRIKTTDLEQERWPMDPEVEEWNYVANTLTTKEKEEGWRLLWDGTTSEGWRSARSDSFPATSWSIHDGILEVIGTAGGESAAGGDIITRNLFSNFELKVEFMLTEGANSGIKYFVDPELNKGEGSAIGLEYQILHDPVHPDAKMGKNGNRTLASLYDLIPAENISVPSRGKSWRGPGSWNQAHIIADGNHVEHWLNGYKVVEYERGSAEYRALVAESKYKVWPNFGESEKGHILLQEHGDNVLFRSIKIKEL